MLLCLCVHLSVLQVHVTLCVCVMVLTWWWWGGVSRSSPSLQVRGLGPHAPLLTVSDHGGLSKSCSCHTKAALHCIDTLYTGFLSKFGKVMFSAHYVFVSMHSFFRLISALKRLKWFCRIKRLRIIIKLVQLQVQHNRKVHKHYSICEWAL